MAQASCHQISADGLIFIKIEVGGLMEKIVGMVEVGRTIPINTMPLKSFEHLPLRMGWADLERKAPIRVGQNLPKVPGHLNKSLALFYDNLSGVQSKGRTSACREQRASQSQNKFIFSSH